MAQVVEQAMVFKHIRILRAAHGDFVGNAPDDDGGMVIVLHDELAHLLDRVLSAIGHMAGDIRNLRPDDHAALVAQIIEKLVVLIMRKADGVRADLADQVHVLFVMLGQQRVADSPAVLMAGDAVERIFPAVEDESALGVNAEAPASEARAHFVDLLAAAQDDRLGGIQIRIPDAVPQMDFFKRDACLCVLRILLRHRVALRIENREADFVARFKADRIRRQIDLRIFALHHRRHGQSGTAEIGKIEMRLLHRDDVHIAVQSAVEGEVRRLRIHVLVGRVVNDDGEAVFRLDFPCDLHAPRGIAAVVMGERCAVHIHIGGGIRAAHFQIQLLSLRKLVCQKLLCIAAGAAEIIVAAVLSVLRVPRMGQINPLPRLGKDGRRLLGILDKNPVLVDV